MRSTGAGHRGDDAHSRSLLGSDWNRLELAIERFEAAWTGEERPAIEAYLPKTSRLRTAMLVELVHAECEFRWKRGEATRAEDYFTRFPELLANRYLAVDLLVAEFKLRQRFDLSVERVEYEERFPQLYARFCDRLHGDGVSRDTGQEIGTRAETEPTCDRTDSHDPVRGTRIGRFELLARIGTGAFASVYKAYDTNLNRQVALKHLHWGGDDAARQTAHLWREARSVAQLSHPGIVSLYEVGESEGVYYLVSEYIEGPNLSELLRREDMTARRSAEICAQVAEALEAAHRQGIVHRDIKPGNIVLDADGRARLTDFGLAKWLSAESTVTVDGQLVGTPAYMAPEQALGDSTQIDARSDVYGLGVVLYEMLTGCIPFGGHPRVVLRRILCDTPTEPRKLNDGVPQDLETICLKAMAKQASRRYPSASAMADDLWRFLRGEAIEARPPTRWERTLAWCRRRPTTSALLAATILGIAVFIGAATWHELRLRVALDTANLMRAEAEQQRRRATDQQRLAETREQRVRDYLYAADVRLAYQAWRNKQAGETLRLLTRHIPKPGNVDRREFAWHYLDSLCHQDLWTAEGHNEDVYSVAIAPDGRMAATVGKDGTLRIWDTTSQSAMWKIMAHDGEANWVAFSPSGQLLATCGDDRTVRLWDIAGGQQVRQWKGHEAEVYCLAFSPDGKHLASGGRDHRLTVWNVDRGNEILQMSEHTGAVQCVAYSPDGRWLTSASSDGNVHVWHADTGRLHATLREGQLPVMALAFSPDSKLLATGGEDQLIRLWDIEKSTKRTVFKGHVEQVQALAFAPGGRYLLSGSKDQTARIWDAATGTTVREFQGHTERVWSVAWTPDGQRIATASGDGTYKLWQAVNLLDAFETTKPCTALAFVSNHGLLFCDTVTSLAVRDISTGEIMQIDAAAQEAAGRYLPDRRWQSAYRSEAGIVGASTR